MYSWVLFALLSAFFAALVALFGKIGTEKLDTTFATAVRSIIMAAFLVSAATILGKWKFFSVLDTRSFMFIVFSGVAGALSWFFYFLALKHGPVIGVSVLDRLSIVFIFILAFLFLGEEFSLKAFLGLILLIFGVVLIIWK